MKIAIVGYGVVGQATENTLKGKYLKDIIIHDPGKGHMGTYLDADLIFLCVPTDTVKAYLEDIPQEKHHDVIIRSTIDYRILGDEFMSAGVWPEFLTERTWVEDSREPICNILGGTIKQLEVLKEVTIFEDMVRLTKTDADMNIVKQYKGKHPFHRTTPKIAALMKVSTNTFYAMKVTFANMLKAIAGDDYHELQKCLEKDERMAAHIHFQVPGPDGSYGYGGKCFPKNVQMFRLLSRGGLQKEFLHVLEELNTNFRDKE